MYTTYDFYTDTYHGGLSEDVFGKLEPRAEWYIRYLTCKNPFEAENEAVSMAVCKAVEVLASSLSTSADGAEIAARPVASESIDGYSVTYGGTDDSETGDDAIRKAVMRGVYVYLLPTGLLYRGLGCSVIPT